MFERAIRPTSKSLPAQFVSEAAAPVPAPAARSLPASALPRYGFAALSVHPPRRPPAPAQLRARPARPPRPNRTGLPDRLKSGVEALSGVSLDGVRVHYNSRRPARLDAHAYARGREIHLAPGQERHLPHETWHLVQQAQGRVRPTMQMKNGVPLNDHAGLEREADIMGARAASAGPAAAGGGDAPARPAAPLPGPGGVAQAMRRRVTGLGSNFAKKKLRYLDPSTLLRQQSPVNLSALRFHQSQQHRFITPQSYDIGQSRRFSTTSTSIANLPGKTGKKAGNRTSSLSTAHKQLLELPEIEQDREQDEGGRSGAKGKAQVERAQGGVKYVMPVKARAGGASPGREGQYGAIVARLHNKLRYTQLTDPTIQPFIRPEGRLVTARGTKARLRGPPPRPADIRVRAVKSPDMIRASGQHEIVPTDLAPEIWRSGNARLAGTQMGALASTSLQMFNAEGGNVAVHVGGAPKPGGRGYTHTEGQAAAHDKTRAVVRSLIASKERDPHIIANEVMLSHLDVTAHGQRILAAPNLTGMQPNSNALGAVGPPVSGGGAPDPVRLSIAQDRHLRREAVKRRTRTVKRATKRGRSPSPPRTLIDAQGGGGDYIQNPTPEDEEEAMPLIGKKVNFNYSADLASWMTESMRINPEQPGADRPSEEEVEEQLVASKRKSRRKAGKSGDSDRERGRQRSRSETRQ